MDAVTFFSLSREIVSRHVVNKSWCKNEGDNNHNVPTRKGSEQLGWTFRTFSTSPLAESLIPGDIDFDISIAHVRSRLFTHNFIIISARLPSPCCPHIVVKSVSECRPRRRSFDGHSSMVRS